MSGDSSLSNAALGLIHEFGSISKNIPARSFLRMPIMMKGKDITTQMSGSSVRNAVESGNFKKVFQILGIIGEGLVKSAFSTGGFGQWAENKPATIRRKGSAAPLIDTGQLRRSITSDVKNKGELNG